MTTKDHFLPNKLNIDNGETFNNNQYSNLNLNHNYQSLHARENIVQSKRAIKNSRKNQNYEFTDSIDLKAKRNSSSWNKSNKHLSSNLLNLNQETEEQNEFNKSKSANSSTLSLHIAAYENSVESDATDSNGGEKEDSKSRNKKTTLIKKQDIIGSSSYITNPFEFPRQQKEDQNNYPEVMQFKASQRLRNPNEERLKNMPTDSLPSTSNNYPMDNNGTKIEFDSGKENAAKISFIKSPPPQASAHIRNGDAMPKSDNIGNLLLEDKASLSIDGLADAAIALFIDADQYKQSPLVDAFIERHKEIISELSKRRLKASDFCFINTIARGRFSEVRVVRHNDSRKVFALKIFDKSELLRCADNVCLWQERDIMAHTQSEWLLRLHYAFQDRTHLYMVIEFIPGGDLANVILNYEIDEEGARFYVAELVLALDNLHSMGFIHRNLHPGNVFISSTGHIKLAGFDKCLKMEKNGLVKSSVATGANEYVSPEMLQQQGREGTFGREVDWWSLGVILYELITGETPFYNDSVGKIYHRIMNYSTNLMFLESVQMGDTSKDLINKLLCDSKVRLGRDGVQQVKSHPFFATEKWTFENLHESVPPFVPSLNGDDDTSYYEDVRSKRDVAEFREPNKAGNEFPFVGFTLSKEYGLVSALTNSFSKKLSPRRTVPASMQDGSVRSISGVMTEESIMEGDNSYEMLSKQELIELLKAETYMKEEALSKLSKLEESHLPCEKAPNDAKQISVETTTWDIPEKVPEGAISPLQEKSVSSPNILLDIVEQLPAQPRPVLEECAPSGRNKNPTIKLDGHKYNLHYTSTRDSSLRTWRCDEKKPGTRNRCDGRFQTIGKNDDLRMHANPGGHFDTCVANIVYPPLE